MSNNWIKQIFRFVIIILLQVVVFKGIHIDIKGFNYVSIIFFPLFLMILPIRTPGALLLGIGFITGFTVDLFYSSPGLHASAALLLTFLRPYILKALEPRGGYSNSEAPVYTELGFSWILSYVAILLFAHILIYTSMEIFAISEFLTIWLKTIASFIFSYVFIVAFFIISNPRI